MSIVNKHKTAADITTPPSNYTTLFFDENGVLFSKDEDGTLVRYSPAGDASGVTYLPDNSLIWTDSTDPGNVAEALDDLALRLNEVESNEYQPADLNDWREQEDPGRTDDALDQLANRMLVLESISPVDVQSGSYLVSGGGVVWNGGYDYTVSAAVYFIGGTQYESAQDDVSLSLADATFDRIDVIAVDTSGSVVVIEGTPASNPAKPEVNSDSQLELSFVFVAAASVAAEVTEEVIYEENAEWTAVSNAGTIVVNSATTPFEGSVVVEATAAVAGNAVTFTDGALNTLGDYSALTMQVRSKASWPGPKRLNFQWRNGGVLVGSSIALRTGVYGFSSAITGSYQSVTIPMADFGVGTQQADELVMSVSGGGGSIGFFVDNIVLQAGTSGGGTTVSAPAMLFRSAWSSSTSYDEQDVVTYLGNTYVCILANSNNTPPNTTYWSPLLVEAANVAYTPQTSLHWTDSEDPGQVDDALDDLAARVNALEENPGGGGTGDVTGPVSSTDNAAALWDGTGGDTLKDSTLVVGASDATIGGHAIYRAGGTDVPVADGGTGVSSLTAYAVICGGTTGTGAVQSIASVGTSGQILTSNGAGALPTFEDAPAGGSLTNWTEAVSTASPNGTIPVTSFTATNAATSVDAALIAKGTGAILAQVPDGTATGGNKRGSRAVDFQALRNAAAEVASGNSSVIGGGERNTASGIYTVVVGGRSNAASGQYAAVLSGRENSASDNFAVVCGGGSVGSGNTASGTTSAIVGGTGNTASGTQSFIGGGASNVASSTNSMVLGGGSCRADGDHAMAYGSQATTRTCIGATANASGSFASQGDAQRRQFVLRSDTTTATPEALTANNSTAGTTNQVILPNNSLFAFSGQIIVRENATGDSKAIEFKGAIKRGANAAATALLGSVTQADLGTPDAGSAAWTVAFTADTTNGGLKIEVTGEASHTLRWVAMVETTEVQG